MKALSSITSFLVMSVTLLAPCTALFADVEPAEAPSDWVTKIPEPPTPLQSQAFGFGPTDYQTTFQQAAPGGKQSPINNQTAVGVPGTVPMGFSYLMRLVYSEFTVDFTVDTGTGEKLPYLLPGFKQSSPGGWLPGAKSEWNFDGIHYEVTYVTVPGEPQPLDLCQIQLTNTGDHAAQGKLIVTLDGAPTLLVSDDLISDRGKPLAIMDPVVPVDRLVREYGCVDPRAIATAPWHPGPSHSPWHHGRIGWYGQPVEYMIKAEAGLPMQLILAYMTSKHLSDAMTTTVEGGGPPKHLQLPRVQLEEANAGDIKPYFLRFVGKDDDGDGFIKISVRAADDSEFQRAILNIIFAFDEDAKVTDEELISGAAREQAIHFIDVGADHFTEVNQLVVPTDRTVFAQRLKYEPDLQPGETKTYLLKFPAIDRKEPATCSYWPRPYDTKESWRGPCASMGRHPENKAPFSRELPVGIDPETFAVFGPKPRSLWAAQLQAAHDMQWEPAMQELNRFWNDYLSQGAKFLVPDQHVEDLYKHSVAILSLFVLRWDPNEEYMQMLGPDFYWEYCTRDNSYVHIAWDVAGFSEVARKLLNTTLKPMSELPPSRYPFGQWDDGSAEYDGAWQTRGTQWDAQGQTLRNITTHYMLTNDKAWLAEHYDAIVKGGDWIIRRIAMERQRLGDASQPGYGLMPLSGLEPPIGEGHSYYVNGYALLGLRQTALAAREMQDPETAYRFDQAANELSKAIDKSLSSGFVRFSDFSGTIAPSPESGLAAREHPNANRFTTHFGGSLVWPTEAIAPHHPMMDAFYEYHTKSHESLGGLMEWPYVYADYGIGRIRRGEYDQAVDLFYCYVANASGTNDWAECMQFDVTFDSNDPPLVGVRGTGDSPHGEACGNYINYLRNLMLHEEGDTLHIAPATARSWLAQPEPLGVENAPSFFGPVTYHLQADPDMQTIRGDVQLDSERKPKRLLVHVRAPGGRGIASVKLNGEPWEFFLADAIIIPNPPQQLTFEVQYEPQ